MRKKSKIPRSKFLSPALFISFIFIAILLIILLEYVEFRKGKDSFIFSNVFHSKNISGFTSDFNRDLLNVLNRNDINYDYFKDLKGRFHFKLDLNKRRFPIIKKSIEKISKKYGFKLVPVEVKRVKGNTIFLFRTEFENRVYHLILISRIEIIKKNIEDKLRDLNRIPQIAFIIDDIGAHNIGALELKKLGIPITASILPFSPRGFDEAKWVYKYGLDEMIHLPMQPKKDINKTHILKNTITIDSSEKYIRSLIKRAKKIVPHACGINNHQGSLVTSKRGVIGKILRVIKAEGLFFVDSRTDFDSVAYKTAKEMKVLSAKRDVFIDHIKDYDHSMFQIKRLVKIAKKRGIAIAIGHPFKSTFKAIADSIKLIRAAGIKIVFVKSLVN